jgi:hypothetical protein
MTSSLPGTTTDAQVASYIASWAALIRISQLSQGATP